MASRCSFDSALGCGVDWISSLKSTLTGPVQPLVWLMMRNHAGESKPVEVHTPWMLRLQRVSVLRKSDGEAPGATSHTRDAATNTPDVWQVVQKRFLKCLCTPPM